MQTTKKRVLIKKHMWQKAFFVFFLFIALPLHEAVANHDWTAQINAYKPLVVNIEIFKQIAFADESRGTFHATGFIVDAEQGIIATNAHVTETSPAAVKISFSDGSFTEAKILYYDPTHDFGFYKIDPQKVGFPLRAVQLGSGRTVKIGDELLMIGNNEREQYSIKYGTVANRNVNKGKRYSSHIHTTFDRTGGSSGSPVWNTRGEVVAIHARGTDVSSFELIIDYVRDALEKIRAGVPIRRGDIGVDLQLISIGDAVHYFHLPEELQSEFQLSPAKVSKVIQVESVIPKSSGENVLQTGDIIYRLDGNLAKDDLYTLDLTLDKHVGGNINLDIYRQGILHHINLYVNDMEWKKITRFVRFAGAVFHDLTPYQRRKLDFSGGGVYMPYADRGSSFASLAEREKNGNYMVVISELAGQPIVDLDDFISISRRLSDGQYTSVVLRDFVFLNRSKRAKGLKVLLKYDPLEIYSFNGRTLAWDKTNERLPFHGVAAEKGSAGMIEREPALSRPKQFK